MTDKTNVDKNTESSSFLDELREFSLTVGEDCPEGHRKDPASGRCLPMGGLDHTAFTRSVNNDDGPEWRGEVVKPEDSTFATEQEVALDADDMDEPESCSAGTTFSFIQRRCITLEDAESEDSEDSARDEEGNYVEEDAAAPAGGGHLEITLMQPEGRRDPVNHDCPANMLFDYKRRECIPLNKDTVMASNLDDEFKKAVATYARLAITPPDPMDGHKHVATLDTDGNGITSICCYGDEAHAHNIVKYVVQGYTRSSEEGESFNSVHPGVTIPEEHRIEKMEDYGSEEVAAPLMTKQRKRLADSAFGVPGKRKFPLDTCARVRNAMSRFNQAKGLTSEEKATLRRKILARAKACDIEVTKFAKATTDFEFAEITQELILGELNKTRARLDAYKASDSTINTDQGPCPPGMSWDSANIRCTKIRGFVTEVANHGDIVKHQPEGRRDTVGFNCPDGWFFDFTNRRCLPLDPSNKPGTSTTKANEDDAAQRDLTAQPEGRPVRLPIDCPPDTIWNKDRNECIPLDSSKKTKSSDESAEMPDFIKKMMDKKKGKKGDKKDKKEDKKSKSEEDDASQHEMPDFIKKMVDKKKGKKKAKSEEEESQTTTNGPGNKGGPGCPDGQFMNPVTKKCMPRKGAFKGKSTEEIAENREGLVPAPAGKLNLPSDCPADTIWDAKNKICRPLSTMDKDRPSGGSPQSPKNTAELEHVESMSVAKLIQVLDEIIKEGASVKEKKRIAAKDLPNAAFPPSMVNATHRSYMHHTPEVEDPYDNDTVDVARLRNALARCQGVGVSEQGGFTAQASLDGINHLKYHAQSIVHSRLEKKE